MTKQEFDELYDSLYFGHDVELEVDGKRYFAEWDNTEIIIYAMCGNEGTKVIAISSSGKGETVEKLFDFKFNGEKSINSSYSTINIIDIE